MTVRSKTAIKAEIAASSAHGRFGETILDNIVDSYGAASVYNVMDYGATGTYNRNLFGGGTGGTDDTAAFQAAINAAVNPLVGPGSGGIVYVPNGSYLIKGGVTLPPFVRLVGESEGTTVLFDGGYNLAPVVTMTGDKSSIEFMTIFGCGVSTSFYGGTNDPFPSHPAVLIPDSSQDACILHRVSLYFGAPALKCLAQDTELNSCRITRGYGSSTLNIGTHGQVWANRTTFDHPWPVSWPSPGTVFPPAWVAATAHAVGDVVIGSGGQYLQAVAVTGDTKTGGVIPPVQLYANSYVDNHVTWQLAAGGDAVVLINSTTISENAFEQCDLTAPAGDGIQVTGSGHIFLHVHHTVISQQITSCIHLGGSNVDVSITANELDAGYIADCFGVRLDTACVGYVRIIGNQINGNGNKGVQLENNNTKLVIEGNSIQNSVVGVNVFSNCGKFIVSGNTIDASGNSVVVGVGTSDFYNITNNLIFAATVSDGGTGVNKTISGNN